MMRARDRILQFTVGLVRLLVVLNLLFALAFMAGLIASWPFGPSLVRQIVAKYGPAADAVAIVDGLRWLLMLGVIIAIPAHCILVALRSVLNNVRQGDTFAPGNAARVRSIGWGLLVIQAMDVPLLLTIRRFDTLGVEAGGYTPSVVGWLSVLVAFVLARVFADGAQMREDLDGTV